MMKYNISDADVLGRTLYRRWEIITPTSEGWTVFLSRENEEYVMKSPCTGTHRLAVSETSADRLRAHWAGFILANFARVNAADRWNDATENGANFLPKSYLE
jgi:hypothetical protein